MPRRSLCLVSGSATAATVPRRKRLVPHCVHRSTNAARAAYPNPSGLVEVLHIVFIPSAAQAKAAAIRRYGRSQALPTLTNSLSSYRGLRPDNYLPLQRVTAPRLRRHTPPLQSVVRPQGFTTAWQPVVVKSFTRRSRSPVTHPKTPVGSTPRPIPAAAPRMKATPRGP